MDDKLINQKNLKYKLIFKEIYINKFNKCQ